MINENVEDERDDEAQRSLNSVGGQNTKDSAAAVPKGKRGWFASLTRRKNSQSQTSLNVDALPSPTTSTSENNNNNNEPNMPAVAETALSAAINRKRKDEKNVFQRFRKKMGLRFNSLRKTDEQSRTNGTTDASAEFLTHSPMREPPLVFRFAHEHGAAALEEPEMVPFTIDYKRFIVKKWLGRESGPNRVMYKACCEMLRYA